MRINLNTNAITTHRNMMKSILQSNKSTKRLSSGLRINSASDDCAGLSISEKIRGQIRGLKQAKNNVQNGISLLQTAEGALKETESLIQRMRQLAVQASNDINSKEDREHIQNELNQLTSEINKISNHTEFNNQKLFKGSTVKNKITIIKRENKPDFTTAKTTIQGLNLEYTTPGSLGNCVKLEFIKPKYYNEYLDIRNSFVKAKISNKNTIETLPYYNIKVILSTNKSGNITSTIEDVKNELNKNYDATNLF